MRPANDKGEELRDVILWLIVLHYAKQSKASIAFISEDKTFQHTDGSLHPTLQRDVERAGVSIAFYRSIGNFAKDNALEQEPLEDKAFAVFVGAEELRRISTEQLLGSRFWGGTIVGAEVSRCELAEARRYFEDRLLQQSLPLRVFQFRIVHGCSGPARATDGLSGTK